MAGEPAVEATEVTAQVVERVVPLVWCERSDRDRAPADW